MIATDKLFGNIFDQKRITNLRLANFAEDCLARFQTLVIEGQFATVISAITVALDNLRNELGSVDTTLGTQKVKTYAVDEFITNFKKTMHLVEGAVEFKGGGKKSELYMELYPNGLKEYSHISKTKMPTLIHRMNDVVNRFSLQLGEDITNKLSTLKTQWATIRKAQEQQMTKVEDNRTDSNVARRALELALMGAIRAVAQEYLVDVKQCEKFFNFHLLFPTTHHHEAGDGVVKAKAAGEIKAEGEDETEDISEDIGEEEGEAEVENSAEEAAS